LARLNGELSACLHDQLDWLLIHNQNGVLEMIAPKYKQIIKNTEPYLLTFPGNLPKYNLKPFGIEIPEDNILVVVNF